MIVFYSNWIASSGLLAWAGALSLSRPCYFFCVLISIACCFHVSSMTKLINKGLRKVLHPFALLLIRQPARSFQNCCRCTTVLFTVDERLHDCRVWGPGTVRLCLYAAVHMHGPVLAQPNWWRSSLSTRDDDNVWLVDESRNLPRHLPYVFQSKDWNVETDQKAGFPL